MQLAACLAITDMGYEKEWWKHTPLSTIDIQGELVGFNTVNTDTNFWAQMEWLDRQQQVVFYTTLLQKNPQSFPWGTWSYVVEVNKTRIEFILHTTPKIP